MLTLFTVFHLIPWMVAVSCLEPQERCKVVLYWWSAPQQPVVLLCTPLIQLRMDRENVFGVMNLLLLYGEDWK